jgi:ADP-heptose:LPS heptosyltransferase
MGDTVVALPSLHLVSRVFPDAERRVLTNFPASGKAAPLEAVIEGSGLVHGYFRYPLGSRNPLRLWSLRQEIRQWSPDVLIYLAESRGSFKVYRDALFFRSCGIRDLIGVPYTEDLQKPKKHAGEVLFESEANRLARCISELGDIDLDDLGSWDLRLNESEEQAADELLRSGITSYVTVSVGTQIGVKDWGEINWTALLHKVTSGYPDLGLVMIGASEERNRSDLVSAKWSGPKLNLCGLIPPRVSAAVLKRSVLFLGHDSGPMHLAAAMGVPCVAIFSARNKPGEWFPAGRQHHVIYHHTDCYGCGLSHCIKHEKKCVTSISVQEVFDGVCQKLEERLRQRLGDSLGVNLSR